MIKAIIGGQDLKEIPPHFKAFNVHYAGSINGCSFSSEFVIYAEKQRHARSLMFGLVSDAKPAQYYVSIKPQ